MKDVLVIGELEEWARRMVCQWAAQAGIDWTRLQFAASVDANTCKARVVVPVTEAAFTELTLKVGLFNWRGSILTSPWQQPLVATLPPLKVMQDLALTARCVLDFVRIRKLADGEQLTPPHRTFTIFPNKEDIADYIVRARNSGAPLSIDIETNPKTRELLMVGFAFSATEAISIPFNKLVRERDAVAELCALDNEKIFQNGFYDVYWLHHFGVPVSNWIWDTLAMHHALDPLEEHSLAHMASVYTLEPYWKDKGTGAAKGKVLATPEEFARYNCRDAAVTWELWGTLHECLSAVWQVDFYLRHYADLFPPLMQMMIAGIRVDHKARVKGVLDIAERLAETRAKLDAMSAPYGYSVFADKAFSGTKLQTFLYEDLALPRQTKHTIKKVKGSTATERTESDTADEVAIRKLLITTKKEEQKNPLRAILNFRRDYQLANFFKDARFNNDRFYFQMKVNTEAGRLASSMTPMDEGSNVQNVDREARHIYVPDDDDHVFLEVDASQIESRIVYMYTGDDDYRVQANRKPWEGDQHKENAMLLFNCAYDEVTKVQRDLGKKVSHGAQRGMTGKRLQETCLKDPPHLELARKEADRLMMQYFQTHKPILDYFKWVRQEVMSKRLLVNPYGRSFPLPYSRLDDTTYRKAYSFLPQSTAADMLYRKGIVPMWKFFTQNPGRMVAVVHDSILMSVPRAGAWKAYKHILQSFQTPVTIKSHKLVVPLEAKIGLTWGTLQEFKLPPNEAEFATAMRKL